MPGNRARTAFGLAALAVGENASQEALAEAVERALDAVDVGEVGADAEDHGRGAVRVRFACGKLSQRLARFASRPVSGVSCPGKKQESAG